MSNRLMNVKPSRKDVFVLTLVAALALMLQGPVGAQDNQEWTSINASTAGDIDSLGAASSASTRSKSRGLTSAAPTSAANDYTTNDDTKNLEKAITVWNQQYCPPQTPITEINESALLTLVKYELISRADMDKFTRTVLIGGKVQEVKKEEPEPEPEPEPVRPNPMPSVRGSNGLLGALDGAARTTGQDLAGRGKVNPAKDPRVQMVEKELVVRNENGQLVTRKIVVPVLQKPRPVSFRGSKFKALVDTIRRKIAPEAVLKPIDGKVTLEAKEGVVGPEQTADQMAR